MTTLVPVKPSLLGLLALPVILLVPNSPLQAQVNPHEVAMPPMMHPTTAPDDRFNESPWYISAAMWLPNRALDLIDIFRLDVGLGGGVGVVATATQALQIGARPLYPASARLGLFGREAPLLIETEGDLGITPTFTAAHGRTRAPSEVGLGIDLLAGVYAGVVVEEIFDFIAGLAFFDPSGDDLDNFERGEVVDVSVRGR